MVVGLGFSEAGLGLWFGRLRVGLSQFLLVTCRKFFLLSSWLCTRGQKYSAVESRTKDLGLYAESAEKPTLADDSMAHSVDSMSSTKACQQ